MILVDTAVWIDHLHRREPGLVSLLLDAEVCVHPMVVGELALGSLRDRSGVLALMRHLPEVPTATHHEVLDFVETHDLHGTGLSLVDAHLLAALRLSRTTGCGPATVGSVRPRSGSTSWLMTWCDSRTT